ncbi:MAG TPA: ATP-binding protein [Acidimicrobiales bacterium]|nr:ATP-binding protein [Acidimicrobiales bacterium]
MTLRRRLLASMIILVALSLAAVDLVTLNSLRSYLYGRTDDQLNAAHALMQGYVLRADTRGVPVTPTEIDSRVSPEIYVEIFDASGKIVVSRPSGSTSARDPAPRLPSPLPVEPTASVQQQAKSQGSYHPDTDSVNVTSESNGGPRYRLQASALPGGTLVVATRLDSVEATLTSLRNIELAVSLAVVVALLALMTLLIRRGLRPLEEMTKEADAISAGDLTRRVDPSDPETEIGRLGRALNGMLNQIEAAFAQRTASEDRLRRFLADASHELRTPLTSIRGYAELLRKDALREDEDREKALARIESEAARMGVLVEDLLTLARIGEGPEPERVRIDMAPLVADAAADARAMDPSRKITVVAPRPVAVAGDEQRLQQLIHNLLANALVHTPAGTPVEVKMVSEGARAILRVKDHGPGMSAEQAKRVFDRFYRGNGSGSDGGSGLGLFIVASVARTLGGYVTVDTELGKGATFEVTLPTYGWGPITPLPPDSAVEPRSAPAPDPANGSVDGRPGPGNGQTAPTAASPPHLPPAELPPVEPHIGGTRAGDD